MLLSLEADVFRKKTRTNIYLYLASHNLIQHKKAVVKTFLNRASILPCNPELKASLHFTFASNNELFVLYSEEGGWTEDTKNVVNKITYRSLSETLKYAGYVRTLLRFESLRRLLLRVESLSFLQSNPPQILAPNLLMMEVANPSGGQRNSLRYFLQPFTNVRVNCLGEIPGDKYS